MCEILRSYTKIEDIPKQEISSDLLERVKAIKPPVGLSLQEAKLFFDKVTKELGLDKTNP